LNGGYKLPHNITNVLTSIGKPDIIKRFYEAVSGFDDNGNALLIDFNKIRPMPNALKIPSGRKSYEALSLYIKYIREYADAAELIVLLGIRGANDLKCIAGDKSDIYAKLLIDDPSVLKFGERLFNNIRNHSAPTWYEWRLTNWGGTKRNAYSQHRDDENTITFETAWSGVPELIREISAEFPGITLSYVFAGENWGNNTGKFEFKGGECTLECQPYDQTGEAREIAGSLFGYPEWALNPWADIPEFNPEWENKQQESEEWADEF
jgi:hypothetical protein